MSIRAKLNQLLPKRFAIPEATKWATVTQASPLRIKLDGESTELPFAPDVLVAGLAVGDRLRVSFTSNNDPTFTGRRLLVLGKSGGFPRMGCTLRVNSPISVNSGGSATSIVWTVEDFDPNNMWSSGSAITIPASGIWSLNFQTEWAAALNTGRTFLSLEDSTGAIYRMPMAPSGEQFYAMSWTMPMSAGVTFTAKVLQTSGAAVNLNVARLHAYRVSV